MKTNKIFLYEKRKYHHFLHKNSKFMGGNSDFFCARVVNLVTYDDVDDQKHIFLVS
jgi:hypothetical protein